MEQNTNNFNANNPTVLPAENSELKNNGNKKIILAAGAAILIIALAILGYFYWKNSQIIEYLPEENNQKTAADILSESATSGVLPSLNAGEINPMQNAPEINPVTKTNPFKDIKTNPFE